MMTPIILCGGSGTRLWPLSRKSYPKQFSKLVGETTLFQACAQRFEGEHFAAPIIVTNSDFRFIAAEQMQAIGIKPAAILIEPEGKNTAPAVLAATLLAHLGNKDARVVVAPSDHLISDTPAFQRALEVGLEAVEQQKLVTFGIMPTHAETAYGYLELPTNIDSVSGSCSLKGFVEKPDLAAATKMLGSNRFLWNAGIFLASTQDMIHAFQDHAPQVFELVSQSIDGAAQDLDFCRLEPTSWAELESISIDYAIMEKAENLSVVPYSAGWSDLGDWRSVWNEGAKDERGVVLSGNAHAIDCNDTLLRSESDGLEVVGIGLENIMAVAMNDAVLIANRDNAQQVKEAVANLKAKQASQAETFPKEHRPWGWFENLVQGSRFQARLLHMKPGASQSLQSHLHRSEHWIVVKGTARVTLEDAVSLVSENQSIYIPIGARHRLENPGKVPVELVEIRTGSYIGEDDIERFNSQSMA